MLALFLHFLRHPMIAAVGNSCWVWQTLGLTWFLPCVSIPMPKPWRTALISWACFVLLAWPMPGEPRGLLREMLSVYIFTDNIFKEESASLRWFLAALRMTSKPHLQLQGRLFAELKLWWVFWQPSPFQHLNSRFKEQVFWQLNSD